MIVIPFAGMIVVPLGLSAGILSLAVHHLPFAGVVQAVADTFIAVVTFFAGLPFAEFHPPSPNVPWLLFAVLFLVLLFRAVRTRLLFLFKPFENTSGTSMITLAGLAFAGGSLLLSSLLVFVPKHRTEIVFPDIGQGDCALVELASGKRVLIDGGGTRDNRFDIGRHVLAPVLWNRGVHKLDVVILSHPHPDHMNGLLFILKKFKVGEVWTHGRDNDLPGYAEFLRIVEEKGIVRRIVSADDPPVMLGNAELRVVHPAASFRPRTKKAYDSENNDSLVVRIADNQKVFLFTGDIGAPAEKYLIDQGGALACDLLKVPHHGSKSSSTKDFVSFSRPKIAVVSVGRGNPYHHPNGEVLARYEGIGSRILRTDNDGAVTIRNLSGRLEAGPWGALVLRKIDFNDRAAWPERERENWNRLRIRAWGT
jgi:competence protein ComEC